MKFKLTLLLIMMVALSACDSAQDRKTKYMSEAVKKFEAGDFDKARVSIKNVLQIDPKDNEARFLLGKIKEKQQEWREAAGNYQSVIENDSNHIEAHVRLAKLYLLGQNIDKAKELFKTAKLLDANDMGVHSLEASILAKEGDYEKARLVAKQAYAQDATNLDNIILYSNIVYLNNDIDKASEIAAAGLQSNKESIALRTLLAKYAMEKGDSVRAIDLFREMISVKPEELEIRTKLALLQTQLRRLDEAEQTLNQSITDLPENVDAKLALIDFLMAQKSEDEALQKLAEFISFNKEVAKFYFAKSKIELKQGKLEEAKSTLENVEKQFETKPPSLQAKNQLALVALREGDKSLAKQYVEEVLKENGKDTLALSIRGNLSYEEKNFIDAISDFRSVLREEPNNGAILKALAKAQLTNNEKALAIDNLKKAALLLPGDSETKLMLAETFQEEGRLEEAEKMFNAMVEEEPSQLALLNRLIRLQLAQQKFDDAITNADSLIEIEPESPLGYYYKGVSYQGKRSYEKSNEFLRKALEMESKSVEPLTALVRNHLSIKAYDKAIAVIDGVLAENSKHSVAYNLKGEVLLSLEKYDEAKNAFNKAIDVAPKWWIPYRGLAAIYLKDNKMDDAANIFIEGIEKVEHKNRLRVELSALYEKQSNFDDAIDQYRNILSDAEVKEPAKNNLAMMLVSHKKDPKSLKEAENLVSGFESSNNPTYLDTLGWVKYHNKKYDEAINYLAKSIQGEQNNPEFHYHLGRAYFDNKQYVDAKNHLEKSLEAQADLPPEMKSRFPESVKDNAKQLIERAEQAIKHEQAKADTQQSTS